MWAQNRVVKPSHLARLCRWLDDLTEGEMIEEPGYCKTYLGFDSISQRELDALCHIANAHLCDYWNGYLIGNNMGEIIPCKLPLKQQSPREN